MASEARTAAAHLKSRLLEQAQGFGYFQAVRLLRLLLREQGHADGDWNRIRIRANLSLGFPEADLDAVEATGEDHYRVTANFLGLYGVSSPLPTFYTEDLLDERSQDRSATRDFLDIFHYALYPLFYDAWAKYRQSMVLLEGADEAAQDRLYALIGLADREARRALPQAYGLLRYAGLLTQFPRSALGLQTLLCDALPGVTVAVESCVLGKVTIPQDQRLCLGVRGVPLGEAALLGQEMDDRMGAITVRLGPVDAETFQELLPYRPRHNWLRFLIRMYLVEPLVSSVELILEPGAVQSTCLGFSQWGQLGLDTWVFSGGIGHEVRASFTLYK